LRQPQTGGPAHGPGRLGGPLPAQEDRTTFSDPEAKALDLIRRAFGPGTELDRTWVGDITYVRTWEGWLYLASVIDLASRRVVGWAMADHMRAELACDALSMAIANRRPGPGLIFHSDRGSQYTSDDFTKLLKAKDRARSWP
jgi:transposase InsO family protein